jgi:hypothetical protein
MLARLGWLVSALAVPIALASLPKACTRGLESEPESVQPAEFAKFSQQLSEEGGYFWSNNYISNETSYLHVMDELTALPLSDGVYVGVGPNQNFTYIAAVRPRLAFIVDIRRQNMLEHLLFKVLLERSETRLEYLSLLLGRPLDESGDVSRDPSATIERIVDAIENTPPDEEFFLAQRDAVLETLRTFPGLSLDERDFSDLRHIYGEFHRQGLDIKYDSWRSFFFPSLKEFLLETDLNGRRRNWLASEESFRFVRDMQRANRIIPVVGDFAGDQAFRRLGRLLESRDLSVSAFYVSNVEFYLFRQRKWNAFVENVQHLPTTSDSVFIRAYANLHRPHPKMVGDHITISLLQNIHAFLRNARAGRYRTLWDVVTADEL